MTVRKAIPIMFSFLFLLCAVLFFVRFRPLVVLSGSMDPAAVTGSLVLVDTCSRNPGPGDIVTFRNGDSYVTHRILKVKGDGSYITKGDANRQVDPFTVEKKELLGTVKMIIPYIGYLIVYQKKPAVICLLICLLFCSFLKYKVKENHT